MNSLLNVFCGTLTAAFLCASTAYAQDDYTPMTIAPVKTTMLQHLRQTGKVSIEQDDRFETLLQYSSLVSYSTSTNPNSSGNVIKAKGYRIRIFSGNNQAASKSRASSIERSLNEKYPLLDTYIVFKSPNWRLTAGNFRTTEEAYSMLHQLKKDFPAWGREMFVIKDEIELPLD